MQNRPSLVMLSGLMLALLGQACAGPSRVEAPVREEPDRFVRVEARYGDADPARPAKFNHPLQLSEKEWIRLLENVWVQYEPGVFALLATKEPSIPAFNPDEIVFLSKWLSKAFKHARPDEWVMFGLTRNRPPGLTEVTTGGWFVEGDRLHLRLANYRYVVTMPSVRGQLWDDPLQSMGDRYYSFAAGDSQSATLVGGGPLGDLRGTAAPQLTIDYKSFLAPPSAAKPVQKPDAPQTTISPEQGLSGDLTRKLRELKQLRDDGLITEEEYRTKKKQLLDRF